jgi:redox-sensitive bicupin YhaK (pirin superfamily)
MGFRGLRVINEDFVEGASGFPTHGHEDMEIITYILEGALEHKDSMGNGSVIRPGDVQRMSAGTGVLHSEYNASKTERVHLLQIWILPKERGIAPSYEQKTFSESERRGRLKLVASPTGESGSVTVHTDAKLFASILEPQKSVDLEIAPKRHTWIQIAKGRVRASGVELAQGDGASSSEPGMIHIEALDASEILVFDLA